MKTFFLFLLMNIAFCCTAIHIIDWERSIDRSHGDYGGKEFFLDHNFVIFKLLLLLQEHPLKKSIWRVEAVLVTNFCYHLWVQQLLIYQQSWEPTPGKYFIESFPRVTCKSSIEPNCSFYVYIIPFMEA